MREWIRPVAAGVAFLLLWLPAPAGPTGDAAPSDFFRPPRRPALPAIRNPCWPRNPIDVFLLARLEARGLMPSPPAERLALLRRVTVDLTGLPPSLQEQRDFLADSSPDAYRKVVDRLLASPHHGERWAQHWLDLVRYAESDGFKADELRPQAHRYRDYVIRAFNADLPYDRFVQQQLAGDELEPDNPEALLATGFNRLWADESNAANLEQRRQEILDDVTDVTGQVFLGLTVGCARCHDHKLDPTTQQDYFRLQAFFAALQPRDDLPAVGPAERAEHQRRLAAWEKSTQAIRAEMEALLADQRMQMRAYALEKFRPEIQQAVRTPPSRRTPYQQQIAAMAEKQMDAAALGAAARLKGPERRRYEVLEGRLAAAGELRPEPLAPAMMVTDVGRQAPPTHRLQGGDWRKPAERVEPGFPHFLSSTTPDTRLPSGLASTGRRAALARWLTCRENPLTARVIVNRLWQHHFGRGIVATAGDFGLMGEPATHPELLDWLAVELMESGWSLKHLHRLMVLSAAYCQDSRVDLAVPAHARASQLDPENHLLWHARRRRLEGEALRDAMLVLSDEMSRRMFGPSAQPQLPAGISRYAWRADPRPQDRHRRSVYVLARRNMRYPLFDVFDLPDLHNSCCRRLTTTTAPQALLLLNGDFPRQRAEHFAARLCREASSETEIVSHACRLAWCRQPQPEEAEQALRFVHAQVERLQGDSSAGQGEARAAWIAALTDFCLALLESNEFLYVD